MINTKSSNLNSGKAQELKPSKTIYLDNHATTPVDPAVLDEMIPYFTQTFGNAASRNHRFGWTAEEAVEKARLQIAQMIGANPKEIIFTSGATESNNLAIRGVAEMYRSKGNHIITTVIEHKAVIDTAKYLETQGFEITFLPVDKFGMVRPEDVKNAITDKTILISVMTANNEIGTINPIAEIGALAKERGIIFHTDAVQAIGRIPVNVDDLKVDLLSISAHKIYGPKGVGALYIRRKNPRVRLSPIIFGGGHERGMRSGTLNVPGIVGFGKAIELAAKLMPEESKRLQKMRDRLHEALMAQLDEVTLNGHPEKRLSNNLNLSFAYVEGEALMMAIPEIAVSSGSACTSASLEPSYVLKAMGIGEDLAHSSLRFGLGRFTTEEEINFAIEKTVAAVKKLREMSPLYEMAKEGIDLKSVQWTAH
ncbi:MAG: IscS subfamily cysteine desulfurase [Deltaproteobacteria bacterium]|nr:IscS subfamily cysteine desulfurase [Deltaproteobacteria bacterium]